MKRERNILNVPNYFLIPIIIILGVSLAFGSVFLFKNFFFLSDSGAIGDTIGGLTTPIFNLIASILIFISFKEQYKANQLQKETLYLETERNNALNMYNQILDLINEIKAEIDSLHFIYKSELQEFHGTETIANLDRTVLNIEKNMYNERFWEALVINLNLIVLTIKKVEQYNYSDSNQKVLKIKIYSYLKLFSPDLYTYSYQLQKAGFASSKYPHFGTFVELEKSISSFIQSTHKELLNNKIPSPVKLSFNTAEY